MALDRLTKVDGGGISTTSDYRVGIITASKFVGPFDGTGGNFAGIITASGANFSGNVSIGGTLTYEDVTNIDSVGIITARDGIHVGAGVSAVGVGTFGSLDIGGDIDVDGHTNLDNVSIAGVVTATTFVGDGDFFDLDVDGHTELDRMRVTGVATFTNFIEAGSVGSGGIKVGSNLFIQDQANVLIQNTGNGSLYIKSLGTSLRDRNNNTIINASEASGARLYHTGGSTRKLGTTATGINLPEDLDVDGHTNLDNVNIAGVTTASGNISVVKSSGSATISVQSNDNYATLEIGGQVGAFIDLKSPSSDDYDVRLQHDGYLIAKTNIVIQPTAGNVVNVNRNLNALEGLDVTGNATFANDLDVDGHTNLDNVSVSGITTFSGIVDAVNTPASIRVAQDIQHKGDADTKITFPANDTISFDTAGSERLRIGSNGDIYIRKAETGASKGSAALEFYGTTSGSLDRDQAKIESSAYAANTNAGNLDFYTQTVVGNNLSLRMRIDGDGHITPGAAGTQNLGSTSAEWGNVYLADDKRLFFGSDQDFSIKHSGTNAFIDNDTGNLNIQSDATYISNKSGGSIFAEFINGGASKLRYAGGEKLATTATGIEVTGEVAATQDYPNFRPTLDFNFAAEKKLDPRITYQRTGPASFINEFGKVVLVGDNAPRFDHDPTTRECKGLLIEHQRTNYAQYSTKINNDQGSYYNLINNAVLVSDAGVAPDGTNTATKMYPASSGSARGIEDIYALPSTGEYTTSVYVKAAGHTGWIALYSVNGGTRAYFNPTTGVAGQPGTYSSTPAAGKYGIQDVGNGWYRCHLTVNLTNTGGVEYFYIYFGDSDGSVTVTHSGTNGILMWGLQVEKGSYPTSYIPTQSDQVTRGADFAVLQNEDFTDAISQTEGTLIAEYDNVTSDGYVLSIDGSGGNKIGMVNSNSYQLMGQAGGSSQGTTDNGTLLSGTNRFALAYKTNDAAISINGNTASVDTSYTLPTTTFMSIGHRQYQYDHLGSCIARIMYYNTRLPNSQLKTLSTR